MNNFILSDTVDLPGLYDEFASLSIMCKATFCVSTFWQ